MRWCSCVMLFTLLCACRPATGLAQVLRAAQQPRAITVNAADDAVQPPRGVVTLRAALAAIRPGGRITFAPALNGREIRLTQIAGGGSATAPRPNEVVANYGTVGGGSANRAGYYATAAVGNCSAVLAGVDNEADG